MPRDRPDCKIPAAAPVDSEAPSAPGGFSQDEEENPQADEPSSAASWSLTTFAGPACFLCSPERRDRGYANLLTFFVKVP